MLEAYLLHPPPFLFLGVGLIEEAVKLGVLMVLTRHLLTRSLRDGILDAVQLAVTDKDMLKEADA
ncbi:hypothetical protein [Actinoplanes regularis]|uniref:hypothetical protein n=1 Tax=Actinoplanes regularis TaxID=52697 RepID=UPI00255698F1|nr:hypothetical protein [Actinoplanes regularis]